MFEFFVYTYGPTLIGAVLCAVLGSLGFAAKRLYEKHVNTEEKKSIARTVASYVQQVWKDIHGPEKMAKALEAAEELLKKKNINFNASEMRIYIEAAVAEFNDAFHQPLTDEASADATRRVDIFEDRQESGLLDE